ncbi:hypothetical protein ACP4OV_016913 [Aristida adscensionis]
MRIRRRPQASLQLQISDPPSTSPQTPQNAARDRREFLAGGRGEDGKLHAGAADLGQRSGAARRLALPQDNAAGSGVSLGAPQGADGVQRSCSLVNGHHSLDKKDSAVCTGGAAGVSEPPAPAKAKAEAEKHVVSNGVATAAAVEVAVKDEEKVGNGGSGGGGGAAKKRRGPAVLMEGSRCSRVNGRGWRCSQPTLVGYSLCEHHLGKGRMRSAAAGGRGGGAGQLGRTEHRARIPAGAGADAGVGGAVTAAAKAEAPSLPRC